MNRMLPSAQLQRAEKTQRKSLRSNRPAPLALEARLMFDGAAIATDRPVAQPDAAGADAGVQPLDKGLAAVETKTPREAAVAPASVATPREIVFVDPGVTDWQQLLKGKPQDAIVIMLDPARDGLTQMAEALKGQSGIDAIHVISHGSEGRLILGGKSIDQAALAGHQGDLQSIGQALSTNGDILLYGCDIAKGTDGAAFIDAVAKATSADVAASTDATGSAAKRGDWNLEYTAGQIDVAPVVRAAEVSGYGGLLATVTIDLDQNDSSGKTGFDYQATYDYREGGLPVCDSDVFIQLAGGLSWENVGGVTIGIDSPRPGDKLDPNWSYDHQLATSLSADGTEVRFSNGWQYDSLTDFYDSIKQVRLLLNTADHSDRTIVFTIWESGWSGLRESKAYATIKVPVNTAASIAANPGGDYSVTEAGAAGAGDLVAGGKLTVSEPDAGQPGFRVPANLNGSYGTFTFNASTGAWGYSLDSGKSDVLKAGQTVTDSLTVKSYDGTASHTITVNILGSNDAPKITSGINSSVPENSPTSTVVYQATATDPDAGDTVTWSLSGTDAAKFNIAADGKVTLKASADFETQKNYSFEVVAKDKAGQVSSQAVTLAVSNVNEAPTANNDTATAVEAGGRYNSTPGSDPTGNVLTNDTDVDAGDSKTVVKLGNADLGSKGKATLQGQYGTLTLKADGSYTYVVDNTNRTVQALRSSTDRVSEDFAYTMQDAAGITAAAKLTVTIEGRNDTPFPPAFLTDIEYTDTSGDDSFSTKSASIYADTFGENDIASYAIAGASSDTSLSGFNLSKAGTYGTLYLNSTTGAYRYVPSDAAIEGLKSKASETFTLTVTDQGGLSDSTSLTVTVFGANDSATISGTATGDVKEDSTSTTGGTLTVADRDTADKGFQKPANLVGTYGTFTFNTSTGVWGYTLNNAADPVQALKNGESVTDNLTVKSADGTASQTIRVTLQGTDDAPVLTAPPTITYTDTAADDTFSVTNGTLSASDKDAGDSKTFAITGAASDSSLSGFDQSLTGNYGKLYLNSTKGAYRYVPNDTAIEGLKNNVSETFTLKVSDGSGASDSKVLTVSIRGANDSATISGTTIGSVEEDGTLTAGGRLTVADRDTADTGFQTPTNLAGTYGTFTFNNSTGVWGYSLNNDSGKVQALRSGESVTDTLTVKSADGTQKLITVSIDGTNDQAVISGNASGSVTEDVNVSWLGNLVTTGKLSVADPDAGQSEFRTSVTAQSGAWGSLDIDHNGKWTYWVDNSAVQGLKAGTTHTDTFTVRSEDGSASQLITVTINGANDAPRITSDSDGGVWENSAASTVVYTAKASDRDQGDTLAWSLEGVDAEAFSIGADGKVRLNAPANFEVKDHYHITVVATDALGAKDKQGVTVYVGDANDPTLVTGDLAGRIDENGKKITGDLNASDEDGPANFFDANLKGKYGQFVMNDEGNWTYTLKQAQDQLMAGQTLTETFTIYVHEHPWGFPQAREVTVTIVGTNDAAVITGDTGGRIVESDAVQSVGGKLSATDIDGPGKPIPSRLDSLASDPLAKAKPIDGDLPVRPTTFIAGEQSGQYGTLRIAADGTWTYVMDGPHNELAQGQSYTDSFTVRTADGTEQVISVVLDGTNDAAVIRGDSSASLVEGDVALRSTGKLTASDVDSAPTFVAGTQDGRYGRLSLAADGTWSYVMDGPHNEFEQGKSYTDSFIVRTADGTAQEVVVTIAGSSDVVPFVRELGDGGAAANAGGGNLFADGGMNSARLAGMRGDLSGTRVPGQSDALSGGNAPFNPEALVAMLPTAAGVPVDLSEFEPFELVRADAGGERDDWAVFVPAGGKASFALPSEMLQGPNSPDFVILQSNGEPLPEWLAFDPNSGHFVGKPPERMHGTVRLQMTGRDAQGNERVVRIMLTVDLPERDTLAVRGDGHEGSSLADRDVQSAPVGRPSLSEQMRAYRALPQATLPVAEVRA